MSKKDITDLVERYELAVETGKSLYFDADEFGELADYYDSQEDIDTAREIVESGLRIHPSSLTLLVKKARFQIYDGDYEDALSILNKLTGYDFDLFLLKIECNLQLENYTLAYKLTEELLEKEESEELDHVYAELGFLHIEADCFKEAVLYFEESLKLNAENTDVLSDLAYGYEMLGNFDLAIDTTNKILDIEPYTYEAWINLGKLLSLKEEFEKAIDAFDFALTINDSETNILKLKAHCLSLSGRGDEAISIFRELLALDPKDTSLYLLLSETYQSLELYDEAILILSEYEKLKGITTELLIKKAWVYIHKEDYKEAFDIAKYGLELHPDSSELKVVLGEVAFKRGDYILAKEIYKAESEEDEDNFHLIDRLAIIEIKNENYVEAARYTEKLLELDPNNLEAKERVALLYFEMDNEEQFNSILEQFTDKELLVLFGLIYSPQDADLFDRDMLVAFLNKARETRTLFKNLKY